MNIKQYRTLDLLILCIITIVFEALNYVAAFKIYDIVLLFLSYTIVLSVIAIYRWGWRGVIVALAGGTTVWLMPVVNDKTVGINISQMVTYILGYGSVIIPCLVLQKLFGKEKIVKNKLLLIAYFTICFLFVSVAKSLIISLFYYKDFINSFTSQFLADVAVFNFSFVISIVILLIAARKNSMMVDMYKYVKDIKENDKLNIKDIKESPKFNSVNPFTEEDEMDDSYILDGGMPTKKELDELEQYSKEQEGGNENEK